MKETVWVTQRAGLPKVYVGTWVTGECRLIRTTVWRLICPAWKMVVRAVDILESSRAP